MKYNIKIYTATADDYEIEKEHRFEASTLLECFNFVEFEITNLVRKYPTVTAVKVWIALPDSSKRLYHAFFKPSKK